jgi:hypothetical protein
MKGNIAVNRMGLLFLAIILCMNTTACEVRKKIAVIYVPDDNQQVSALVEEPEPKFDDLVSIMTLNKTGKE